MHACTDIQTLGGSPAGPCQNATNTMQKMCTCCRCSHAVYSSHYNVIAYLLEERAQRQAALTIARVTLHRVLFASACSVCLVRQLHQREVIAY